MAETTKIEWTDATWNVITGCTLVSDGCRHCYAATLAATRMKHHPSRKGLARVNAAGEAKFTGEVRFNERWLDQPLRWKRGRKVFVCAHGDLFHESVPDEWIDRVFAVMARAPHHTFQVLTKRPERARKYLSGFKPYLHPTSRVLIGKHSFDRTEAAGPPRPDYITRGGVRPEHRPKGSPLFFPNHWPLPNVWLGTSVEDQVTADARIPYLLATPAAVRFVSAEPLLGPVDLTEIATGWHFINALGGFRYHDTDRAVNSEKCASLDLVIVGGESGKNARPMHPDWARSLRDQCVAAGVAFHFKQWGEWHPGDGLGDEVDGAGFGCFDDAGRWVHPVQQEWASQGRQMMFRVGKRAAGRLLDGRTWDQMPGVAA